MPESPDQTVAASRTTPITPARNAAGRPARIAEIHPGPGRQRSSSSFGSRHIAVSRTKVIIRTSAAPQANSHSGIGRSFLPTRAWARRVGNDIRAGETVPTRP